MWRQRRLTEGTFCLSPATPPEILLHAVAFMTPCSTLSRTELVRRCGGFIEDRCMYAEDAALWLKLLLRHPVGIDLRPGMILHAESSALSHRRLGPHPLEPFLKDPSAIEADCPAELRPLLAAFLSIRAFKTACVWSVWGRWREARELRRRFRSHRDFRLPYFWPSLILATPFGGILGRLIRTAVIAG